MAKRLPTVCIFGARDVVLRSSRITPRHETTELSCFSFGDDRDLEAILRRHHPHVVVTIGRETDYPRLMASPLEVRRRWLNFADLADLDAMGEAAFQCYVSVCLSERPDEPLVSIFTPTFRTGNRFARTYLSVAAQTYRNWEWVLWDDSDDAGETLALLQGFAAADHRLHVIRPQRHSGIIGEVKYNACMACRGTLLVELDHDDELMPNALADVVAAATRFPNAGFFYSDFAEVTPSLGALRYGDGWGHGYGAYRIERVRGSDVAVAVAPNVNPKTIRGLVAAPNHVRAWRRSSYLAVSGHNRDLHVADDMDLMIRTFLHTRMVRIPALGYLQIQDGSNTQTVRNADIQRHVRALAAFYDRAIHDRFVALGLDDFVWDAGRRCSDLSVPNPAVEPVASLTAPVEATPVPNAG